MAASEDSKQRQAAYGRHTEKRSWLHIDLHGICQVTLYIEALSSIDRCHELQP